MKILLAHARSNEEGKTAGGKAGDQTGKEVCIQEFFEYRWQYIFRAKDPKVAEYLAANAEVCCKNDHIGYDHPDRYSMYLLAKADKYNFEKITKDCNTDCSQMTATLINGAGISISPYIYTRNMRDYILQTGKFDEILYTNKSQLQRGDILLTVEKGHVVIITQGDTPDPQPSVEIKFAAEVYGKELVVVHSEPNESSLPLKLYPALAAGNKVDICDEREGWCYIRIAGKYYGWLQRVYLLRFAPPYAKGTVTTDLHMRTNPGQKYKSLAIMPKGTTVDIFDIKPTDTGAEWYYINYKGVYGFASARYIKLK